MKTLKATAPSLHIKTLYNFSNTGGISHASLDPTTVTMTTVTGFMNKYNPVRSEIN
jgi:hypothetical protein